MSIEGSTIYPQASAPPQDQIEDESSSHITQIAPTFILFPTDAERVTSLRNRVDIISLPGFEWTFLRVFSLLFLPIVGWLWVASHYDQTKVDIGHVKYALGKSTLENQFEALGHLKYNWRARFEQAKIALKQENRDLARQLLQQLEREGHCSQGLYLLLAQSANGPTEAEVYYRLAGNLNDTIHARDINILHTAVSNGNEKQIESLLKQGVDPNPPDAYGYSALHYATTPEAIQLLYNYGAHINLQTQLHINLPTQPTKKTPLTIAQEKGLLKCVKKLLELEYATEHSKVTVEKNTKALHNRVNTISLLKCEWTFLHLLLYSFLLFIPIIGWCGIAAHYGHQLGEIDTVKWALEPDQLNDQLERLDRLLKNEDNWRARFEAKIAVKQKDQNRADKLLKQLEREGHRSQELYLLLAQNATGPEEAEIYYQLAGNLNDTIHARDLTILHSAVLRGEIEEIESLLTQGIDPNMPDAGGYSALHYATTPKVIQLLYNYGARIDLQTRRTKKTPLMIASENGNLGCVEELLELGAHSQIRDYRTDKAIHWAAWKGHLDIVIHLLQQGESTLEDTGHLGWDVLTSARKGGGSG